MFVEELISILTAAGVGNSSNIFASSKAVIPAGAGPFLTITETGGSGPEGTHNSTVLPAYQRPNAQILVQASDYCAARAMATAAYAALYPIRNQLVQGVWWKQVIILQEPFDLGVNNAGRATVAFNIAVTKRPNAAMSA